MGSDPMDRRGDPAGREERAAPDRDVGDPRVYRPPRLTYYGTVAELTENQGQGGFDGLSGTVPGGLPPPPPPR